MKMKAITGSNDNEGQCNEETGNINNNNEIANIIIIIIIWLMKSQ
jgi:hypothetical protein